MSVTSLNLRGHQHPNILAGGCLLCSKDKPHQCHRRLVVEYLQRRWGNLNITHII